MLMEGTFWPLIKFELFLGNSHLISFLFSGPEWLHITQLCLAACKLQEENQCFFIFTNYPPAFRNCLKQFYPRHIIHIFLFPKNIFSLQKVFYHYPHTAQSKARLGFWGWLKGRFKDDFRNIFKSRFKCRLRIRFKDRFMGGSYVWVKLSLLSPAIATNDGGHIFRCREGWQCHLIPISDSGKDGGLGSMIGTNWKVRCKYLAFHLLEKKRSVTQLSLNI